MPDRTCLSIILAAGEGTRMKSARPKVLHEIAGLPMLAHVAAAAAAAGGPGLALVVGHGAEEVRQAAAKFAPHAEIFVQDSQLGTAHAVLAASVQAGACAAAVRVRPSSAAAVASLAMAEGVFAQAMARLLGQLDRYPALGSRGDVAASMAELVEIESRLAFARKAFNDAAGVFNEAALQFPTRVLSRLFGLRVAGRL